MTIRAQGFEPGTFELSQKPATAAPAEKPVTLEQVAPYAQRGHYVCRGKGIVYKAGKLPVPCRCAQKRFMKANDANVRVDDKTKKVTWR